MTDFKAVIARTRSTFSRILGGINGRIKAVEFGITAQDRRLSDLESKGGVAIQEMELKESRRRDGESLRRSHLRGEVLRLDLEKQYGTTGWANRLIGEILKKRSYI